MLGKSTVGKNQGKTQKVIFPTESRGILKTVFSFHPNPMCLFPRSFPQ